MKTFLLILGIVLFIIGFQDAIRILADNANSGIFGWLPGGFTLYLALDIALAISGGILAKHATQLKSKIK